MGIFAYLMKVVQNENLLRTVLDALPVGVWITDRRGKIVRCNSAARRIWEGNGSIGVERFLKAEEALEEEIEIECDDGRRKTVLCSVIPIRDTDISGAVVISQDITRPLQKERECTLLATAIDQIAEGIILTNTEWIIQYVNPGFERMCGYVREELIGSHPRILKSGRHDKAFYKAMWRTVKDGEVWRGQLTSRKKDGTLYEVEAAISPVRDHRGRVIHFAIIERDITRQVQFERQLQQAQRLEELGNLAGGIAHDFNNILMAIQGFAQLAMTRAPEGSRVKDYLEDVLKAGERAKDLVTQILAFSRRAVQQRKPVQVRHILDEALRFLRVSLPSAIEICQAVHLSPKAGEGMILADPTLIQQVIMNLATNAAHAIGDRGGLLQVGLADVDLNGDAASLNPGLKPGPYLKLTVADNGSGIDPAVIDHIFEPYFTTKKAGEGTGLGLAVAHGIVKSHGGTITVESEPGKGTIFQVHLPLLPRSSVDSIDRPADIGQTIVVDGLTSS